MTYQPLDIEGRQRQIEAQAKREKERERKVRQEFRRRMQNREGRRDVWRAMERSGMFSYAFEPDTAKLAHREGKREEGLYLHWMILQNCPQLYPVMMEEMVKELIDERNSNNAGADE